LGDEDIKLSAHCVSIVLFFLFQAFSPTQPRRFPGPAPNRKREVVTGAVDSESNILLELADALGAGAFLGVTKEEGDSRPPPRPR